MSHCRSSLPTLMLLLGCALPSAAKDATPSFEVDVQAVLAKAGCNAGACHGNQNGKGGFRLSLRGQDPGFDHDAIVGFGGGRRIDRIRPEQSLLLLKPTLEIAHQGGKRFGKDTQLYAMVHDWIGAGATPPQASRLVSLKVRPRRQICFAPRSRIQLEVEASFSDGSSRDVTNLAVYEPSNLHVSVSDGGEITRQAFGEATVIVRFLQQQVPVTVAFLPTRDHYAWRGPRQRNRVDRHVFDKLRAFRVNPAPVCDDHVFLRRVHFDLLGVPPTAEEAKRFVANRDPGKREQWIDAVLARPEFADHWALKWADLLRVEEKVLDRRGVSTFHQWIRDSFAEGRPLNEFVRELLVARGSTYKNPPTNYFRALRQVNQRGEASARVFLGTRLQCAQCHNHPFDRWTQDDYYAWAALFARVDYEIIENKRADRLDKNQFNGEQLVKVKQEGEVVHPTTGATMVPRFLGAVDSVDDDSERLVALSKWLTSPDNRQFARSQVNRLWFHLMGQGLVEPVDDFRLTNPPSHPELLEFLTDALIDSNFDIRYVLRIIMQSTTYQLASDAEGSQDYSQVAIRRLSAEQLLDAQSQSLQAAVDFNGHARGTRAGQLPGVHKVRIREQAPSAADRFLFAFGKPERLMTCECERSDATTLSQALLLVNGECIDQLLTQESNLIGRLLARDHTIDDIIRELYWSTLSRPPSDEERHQSHSVVAASKSKRQGLEDVAWALLNAKEFVFRQ